MNWNIEMVEYAMRLVQNCDRRASTPKALAKKGSEKGLQEADMRALLDVLGQLPYIRIQTSPSGRLAGLEFESCAQGVCGLKYRRMSPGYVQYFRDGKFLKELSFSEYHDAENRNMRAELEAYAKEHNMPFLDEYRDSVPVVVPFVLQKLVQHTANA